MKSEITQKFILTIQDTEYPPFLFFLSFTVLPAELDDKWNSGPGLLKVCIILPMDFHPGILMQMWYEWKDNDMEADYAVLN